MEVDMINNIAAAMAAAILLASVGAASAQTGSKALDAARFSRPPYAHSYYNDDYWRGMAPFTFTPYDPYAGSIWEGVAPY
jgi:hypothetical protein